MQPISSANLYTQTINDALTVQSQWAVAESQQASGLQAQDFGTLGGSSSRELLNLQAEISQSQNWATVAQTTASTTQAMYSSVGTMASVVNKLQVLISQSMASPNNSDLLQEAQQLQSALVTQVNAQVGGSYLFAGSNSSLAPADLTHYPAINATTNAYNPAAPDTSYYTGDNKVLSVQVNLQQTVNYGVTADNPAIEEAMRAIQQVASAAQVSEASTQTAPSPTAPTNFGGTLTVNGVTYNVPSNASLQQIATALNGQANGNGFSAQVVPDSAGQFHLQIANGMNAMTVNDSAGLGFNTASVQPLSTAALTGALQNALTTANKAESDLSNLQQNISNSSSQLTAIHDQQTSFVTYLQTSLSNVKDVDTAAVASKVQQYQTQLQASFLAVSSLTKLSLAQFL